VNAPDISAVRPLAQIAGADPSQILDAVGVLEKDHGTIREVASQAAGLIGDCARDLIGLVMELGTRAVPIALGLLVPNPAARLAAETALRALAMEYLGRALSRAGQLVNELGSIAAPLVEIASRTVSSTVDGGKASLNSLEATPQQAALAPAGQSTASTKEAGVTTMSLEEPAPSLSSSSASGSSDGSAAGAKAVDTALSMVGAPYAWGGTSPNGFDCSGLTQYAYREAGVELPRLAEEQTVGQQVSADELVKGDLVVWNGHVAMYAGDGQIVEAGDPVQVNPLRTSNMGMEFKGFWRPTA
ncbi:MAG: C40 family peptidase, partial [Corynebacterium casei]|nr:C40 family peptidase [Corynebacterium casei]